MDKEELNGMTPEEYRKYVEEIKNNPQAKLNFVRNKNWLAHGQIKSMGEYGSLRCPHCGNSYEELVWKCCGIPVKDVIKELKV